MKTIVMLFALNTYQTPTDHQHPMIHYTASCCLLTDIHRVLFSYRQKHNLGTTSQQPVGVTYVNVTRTTLKSAMLLAESV
uniref:Uncharacterized protein n=1 Tax=Anguilla anguilla TaxID=7936 RepID=A0A0E9PDP3_ANGAN